MTRICEDRVETARAVCETLKTDKNETVRHMVKGCTVDDWNQECTSFSMFVSLPLKKVIGKYYPENKKKWSLRSLTYGIRRAIKKHGTSLNWIEHPKATYETVMRESSFDGYDRDYTHFDINV